MKNMIFYFTGTGNSLAVAKQIGNVIGETKLNRIVDGMKMDYSDETIDCLGIVYPVYYGAIPGLVENFINNVRLPMSTYNFVVVTCGGMAAGANDQTRKRLEKKGVSLDAGYTVMMPSNNQTAYPPPEKNRISAIITQSTYEIDQIAFSIKNKERKAIHKTIASIIAPPLSKIKFPVDSDKNFQVEPTCVGCGLCMKVCPRNNIELINGQPTWTHRCSRCTACMQVCPKRAIHYGQSRKWGPYLHPEIGVNELIVKTYNDKEKRAIYES